MSYPDKPIHGVGIGLRSQHFKHIFQQKPNIPWFEALTENYIHQGERATYHLGKIREDYPITFHGVSLSIGSTDPLNHDYLLALKRLIQQFEPSLVSDHLCWVSLNRQYVPDLLPLPYTEEALDHVVSRIHKVQDFLQRQILIENVSSYLQYKISIFEEWGFITEVAKRSGCALLLDVNNVYVSSQNHHFDPTEYLKAIPIDKVKEIHLGGYEDQATHLLDTHGKPIHPPVWSLYEFAIRRFGQVPTLIEWDNNIPTFDVLHREQQKASEIYERNHDAA